MIIMVPALCHFVCQLETQSEMGVTIAYVSAPHATRGRATTYVNARPKGYAGRRNEVVRL